MMTDYCTVSQKFFNLYSYQTFLSGIIIISR